jgi:Domain of unknown function (DUF6458)
MTLSVFSQRSPGNSGDESIGGSMGLGVSIFLIAVGAILAFAVNTTVSGLDINTVGWILLIVGIGGLVLSMIFWSSWGGPAYWSGRRRATYVDEGPPPA